MKLFLFAFAFTVSLIANANENGSYTQCKSASGRTILTMGNVGSMENPQTVELKIDNKSLGAAEIDGAVILKVENDGVLKFIEADELATDFVTVKMSSDSKHGRILSGIDPRDGKPLAFQIQLSCEVVINP